MTEPADVVPEIPPEYATFSNRMVATVIDLGILYMIALPLVDLIMAHFFPPVDVTPFMKLVNSMDVRSNPPAFFAALFNLMDQQHMFTRFAVENLLQIFFIALYTLPFWFRFSSTPGKMLFRLEIRDVKTRAPMTRKQAVVRFLGYFVSALPLTLGFVWVLMNNKRRAFHDLIAGTVVIVAPKSTRE